MCDPTPKVNNAKIKCYLNNEEVDCTKTHLPGTVIRPHCDSNILPNVEEAVCDESGKWHVEYFECFGEYDFQAFEEIICINQVGLHKFLALKDVVPI